MPDRCDQVTTVSAVDTAPPSSTCPGLRHVHTVPNGVDDAYLAPMPPPGTRRGVAFWGNLDFPPNANALAYFIEHHLPTLRAAGVELCVVGASAPDWLRELARREPLIELAGFVPDLRAAVTHYPVMINPMRTGSGLKNKVLEAFGLGLAVVSTPMGVEALSPVRRRRAPGRGAGRRGLRVPPCFDLLADEPRRARLRAGANALLHRHYRWSEVGRCVARGARAAGPRWRRRESGPVLHSRSRWLERVGRGPGRGWRGRSAVGELRRGAIAAGTLVFTQRCRWPRRWSWPGCCNRPRSACSPPDRAGRVPADLLGGRPAQCPGAARERPRHRSEHGVLGDPRHRPAVGRDSRVERPAGVLVVRRPRPRAWSRWRPPARSC